MTKSDLVKIGVPSALAESFRHLRHIRRILEQHDAAVARLNAATNERIREAAIAMTEEHIREAAAATAEERHEASAATA
jgi:hypothetical protein